MDYHTTIWKNEPDILLVTCCELCDPPLRVKAKLQRNVYLMIPTLVQMVISPSYMYHACMYIWRLWEDSGPGCHYCLLCREGKDGGVYCLFSFVCLSIISLTALSIYNFWVHFTIILKKFVWDFQNYSLQLLPWLFWSSVLHVYIGR